MWWKKTIMGVLLTGWVLVGMGTAGWAQKPGRGALGTKKPPTTTLFDQPAEPAAALKFPTEAAEIIQILGVKPQFNGNGVNARGLGGIAEDQVSEEIIARAPKVGALILFDFDSTNIKADSQMLLDTFAKAFQSDALQDAVFLIAGHTDNQGKEEYNLQLSQNRAVAVKDWLVTTYHLDKKRFLIKPYGETKPLVENDTEDGRAHNRRVEFIRIQ